MSNILNPLYARPNGDGSPNALTSKKQTTARIENTREGICPKCQQTMGKSKLGQSMGNQEVYFCGTCRVAEPIPC